MPQERLGRRIQCVNCQSPFTAEAAAGVGASAAPVAFELGPAAPPREKTLLAPLEEPIRYNCPRCGKALEAPRSMAGQKHNCPGCGQRLQIPQPPAAPPPLNKTILATESSAAAPPAQAGPSSVPPTADVPYVEVVAGQSARRERCLECGRDLTGHERPLTCAKCGALFCCSACYRDHEDFVHGRRRRPREERPLVTRPLTELPQSGLGIASFILGLSAIVLFLLMLIVLGTESGRPYYQRNVLDTLIGLLSCGTVSALLVGAGLGIGGCFQEDRQKVFAILGLCLNSSLLLIGLVLFLIGAVVATT